MKKVRWQPGNKLFRGIIICSPGIKIVLIIQEEKTGSETAFWLTNLSVVLGPQCLTWTALFYIGNRWG